MIQEVEMTDQEKLDMYMKLSKEELAKMLIEANKHLKSQSGQIFYVYPYGYQGYAPIYPAHPTIFETSTADPMYTVSVPNKTTC